MGARRPGERVSAVRGVLTGLALLLAGCATGDELRRLDVEGRAATRAAAIRAAAEWTAVCGVPLEVREGLRDGVPLREVDDLRRVARGVRESSRGLSTPDPPAIWVVPGGDDLQGTIAHEIGHAVLGLWGHTETGVMRSPRPAGARVLPSDCPPP
jgi:hypothetical protein